MLDKKLIGHRFKPIHAAVEAGRLRAFNNAIGETSASFTSSDRNEQVPIPPTYLFCLEMLDAENPFGFVEEIGVGIDEILHADQNFTYYHPVFSGDHLIFTPRLSDVIVKKGGALTFLVQDVDVHNQDEMLVARIKRTFAVRREVQGT